MKTKTLISATMVGLCLSVSSELVQAARILPPITGTFHFVASNSPIIKLGDRGYGSQTVVFTQDKNLGIKLAETVSTTLKFHGFSTQGNVETETVYASPHMHKALFSGSPQLSAFEQWDDFQCDGKAVEWSELGDLSLPQLIYNLLTLEIPKYRLCQFAGYGDPVTSEPTVQVVGRYYLNRRLVLMESGEVQYLANGYAARYAPEIATDLAKESVYVESAKAALTWVKAYGQLIESVSNKNEQTKANAAKSWFEKNKAVILGHATKMEENVHAASELRRAEVRVTTGLAFRYLEYIESKSSMPVTFQQLIHAK